MTATNVDEGRRCPAGAFIGGAGNGGVRGLIGLGGAEVCWPLLIGRFGFGAVEAVIVNKAMSLIVIASALPSEREQSRSPPSPTGGRSSPSFLRAVCLGLWRERRGRPG